VNGNLPFRCGFIAIVGRPNVGKSTLLNHLIGQKISITSRKAQTTRHRITGILTGAQCQFVFVDTPGFQTRHKNALNRGMNRLVTGSMRDVHVVLFVIEARHYDDRDRQVLKLLPEGGAIFAGDEITDRNERFLAAELLREKVFRLTGEELPYSASTVIEQFKQEKSGMRRIHAAILVDKEAHKSMLIGKDGLKLKEIATQARLDMEKLFGAKVFLEVFVKVRSGWADDERMLKSLGYE
jgi:GTP-binding protein Era